MSADDHSTHDRAVCSVCEDQIQKWGEGGHCDRTHDFREGDLVTLGEGLRPWRVVAAHDVLVTIEKNGRKVSLGRGCRHGEISRLTRVSS